MDAQKFNCLLRKIKYDGNAVQKFYEEFYTKIKARVKYRFGKLVNEEDVAQEIFMKLYTMDTPEYVKAPAAWLQRFIDNYVIDQLRVSHTDLELSETQPADFDIERTILEVDLKNAFSHLDKLTQQIVYMHFVEGFKLIEVSKKLKLSYVNVRQIVSRAYKELKPYLKNENNL